MKLDLMDLLMLSIYIPFYIKYGCERGKVIMLMVCGGVFAGGFVIAKLFKTPPTWLQGTLDSINNGNDKMALLCLAVIIVLLTVISYFCSVSIMEKKEF